MKVRSEGVTKEAGVDVRSLCEQICGKSISLVSFSSPIVSIIPEDDLLGSLEQPCSVAHTSCLLKPISYYNPRIPGKPAINS